MYQITYPETPTLFSDPVERIRKIRWKQKFLEFYWFLKIGFDRCRYPLQGNLQLATKPKPKKHPWKILYASPVGAKGKPYLAKVIHRFGHENFDYLIFAYDDTSFDEPVFEKCKIIREKGILCYFYKKYLTPEYCQGYDYIFPWVDDIDIHDFSYQNFLDIFERNKLDMAQPALSHISVYSHDITLQHPSPVGRFTDFAEVMVQVFTRDAWTRYWKMMEADHNFWGWGYDHLAKSYCHLQNVGIIDCEPVIHMRKSSSKSSVGRENHRIMMDLFERHKTFHASEKKILGELA